MESDISLGEFVSDETDSIASNKESEVKDDGLQEELLINKCIEEYVMEPSMWGSSNSIPIPYNHDPSLQTVTPNASLTRKLSSAGTDLYSSQLQSSTTLRESQIEDRCSTIGEENNTKKAESWLSGGPLGSRNAVLIFRSSALANATEACIQTKPGYLLHTAYKVSQAETKLLSKLLESHGMSEACHNTNDFNLLWTGSHPKPGILRSLLPHQKVNHFPRSYELTRKDRLYKNIERMQHGKGYKQFDFVPQTFVMPGEYRELCTAHYRVKGPWIVKPVASSRGRGIFIVENPSQVPLDEPVVVAKYINKPLLVEGHKCDLRLYVLVSSFDPLIVYIYEEGLVRLATVRYDSSHKQLWNPCMHLCNYSINKYHSDYVKSDDPSAENVGHKWTLSALLRHLKSQGKDTALLMSQIEDVIVKAILATAGSIVPACQMFVPHFNTCFELYGFDILIDENFKPWLLEVNLSPSLGCDSPLDVRLKSAMLADLLTLVGIPAVDPILRLAPLSLNSSNSSMRNNSNVNMLKMKLSGCRRVHSADALNHPASRKSSTSTNGKLSLSKFDLSPEEIKIVRIAKQQFERRGGFVRIFPAVDSWAKYSQYLESVSGIPTNGAPSSVYSLAGVHNYNQMLFTQLYPQVQLGNSVRTFEARADRHRSHYDRFDKSLDRGALRNRQERYERMLSQGYKATFSTKKLQLQDSKSNELKNQMLEAIGSGKKLTQNEARKTFSQYLECILKRISGSPDHGGHVEIVLKFLQKASNYLRTPFSVKIPSHKLIGKDRAAIVAKQLNDFLYLYNRETEMYGNTLNRPTELPTNLFIDFLENARECDLEEVLMQQSLHKTPANSNGCAIQTVLRSLPTASNSNMSRSTKSTPRSAVRVSSRFS